MKTGKWITFGLALALAGLMTWTGSTWAQGAGPGGPPDQTGRGQGRGQGSSGQAYCPNYPGQRNCPYGQANPQGPRGPRGKGAKAPVTAAPSQPEANR